MHNTIKNNLYPNKCQIKKQMNINWNIYLKIILRKHVYKKISVKKMLEKKQ